MAKLTRKKADPKLSALQSDLNSAQKDLEYLNSKLRLSKGWQLMRTRKRYAIPESCPPLSIIHYSDPRKEIGQAHHSATC
jgi:hypothetical protein